MRKLIFMVTTLFIFILTLPAQGNKEEVSYAIRTDKPITVDGQLNEPIWNRAAEVNRLLFIHKSSSEADQIQTLVRALYDEKYLYLGFQCIDTQPESIYAEITHKDGEIQFEDSVWALLDVYENLDKYYYFGLNILGARSDGVLKKDISIIEPQWDGKWEAGIQRTEEGWSVELAIDLNDLMFRPKEGETIGISLSRVVPRLAPSYITEPLDPAFNLSQIERLQKLGFMFPEKKLKVTPCVMPKAGSEEGFDLMGGVDATFKLGKTYAGHVTVNPDFFTMTPDKEVFNLTRYELNLPEQREFFREGGEIFSLPKEQLFYSKRIGDIYGGVKAVGNIPGFEFAVSSSQTKKLKEQDGETANFSVVRLNKSILSETNVGLLVANKLIGGKNFGVAGLDTTASLSTHFSLEGQFAISYGDYNSANTAFSIIPRYDTETTHFHFGYTQVGERFGENVNNVGYIWDDNRREFDVGLDKAFVMQKAGIEWIKYISNYNVFWGIDGTLRSWDIDQGLSLYKQNRFEISIVHTQEFKLFEKEYRNHRTKFFLGFDTREWTLFNVSATVGENYDKGFMLIEFNKRHTIGQKFSFEYAFQFLDYFQAAAEQYQLQVFRAEYEFTKNLQLKTFFQWNSQIDKLNLQVFMFYKFRPPYGMLQFGYQRGDPRYGIIGNAEDIFFIKMSYQF
jgi:hypothetical protein